MLRTGRGPMFWIIPIGVIVLAAVLVGVVIVSQGPDDEAAGAGASEVQNDPAQDEVDLSFVEHRVDGDARAVGDVDAPVTMVAFSDYQCPYCATWNAETMPAMKEFVDKGDLRVEMRDLAIFGEESERAARAAWAAGEQGAYWDFHNALFKDGEHLPKSKLDDDSLVELGEDLGLDPLQFKRDMNSVTAHDDFDADAAEGQSIGVASTPAFIIGGKPLVGAQPTKDFVEAVDDAIARTGS